MKHLLCMCVFVFIVFPARTGEVKWNISDGNGRDFLFVCTGEWVCVALNVCNKFISVWIMWYNYNRDTESTLFTRTSRTSALFRTPKKSHTNMVCINILIKIRIYCFMNYLLFFVCSVSSIHKCSTACAEHTYMHTHTLHNSQLWNVG